MRRHHDRHHRRSIRLKDYDYSQAGYYFVTICAQDRASLFGKIIDGEMRLNRLGCIVNDCWRWLSRQYPYVKLGAWVVMPNHLHGIVVITDGNVCGGGSRTAPTPGVPRRKGLGRLIGAFKTVSAKEINKIINSPGKRIWQRSFHDHIIRNDTELHRIREYILNNPLKWHLDKNNPINL